MQRKLPPLKALRAYEAAARHSSFTRAAEELFVTPTAIRHHVKLVEDWLGVQLFRRSNNSLSLTQAGESLLPVVTEAFDRIACATDKLRGIEESRVLTISARPNFALRWLVPRLQRFAEANPRLQVRLVTAARSTELMLDEIDAAVYLGEPRSDEHCERLFTSDLLPVCSPLYLRTHRLHSASDLNEAMLLHTITSLDDWGRWLAAADVSDVNADIGPQFDSYALVLQAALGGWGVAMASALFIQDDVAAGRLVAPFKLRIPLGREYYLVCRNIESPPVASFRKWLLEEARRSVDETAELINNSSWA